MLAGRYLPPPGGVEAFVTVVFRGLLTHDCMGCASCGGGGQLGDGRRCGAITAASWLKYSPVVQTSSGSSVRNIDITS